MLRLQLGANPTQVASNTKFLAVQKSRRSVVISEEFLEVSSSQWGKRGSGFGDFLCRIV